jgi:hypothetical protein
MGSTKQDESAPGGESSADYMISESDKQEEQESYADRGKQKKSGLESVTDTIKNKVTETGKSIKGGVRSTVEGVTGDSGKSETKDLDSAQVRQGKIGDAAADPGTTGPTESLREKAADTVEESEDSAEPA